MMIRQIGFTYLFMLVALVVMSIAAGTASVSITHGIDREKEAELMFRGDQYYEAIRSYYLEGGRNRYPRFIADLIKDPRFIAKHHIRNLYADPLFSGEDKEFQMIYAPDGGVMGVVSTSTKIPLKKINFRKKYASFSSAQSYLDWRFVYLGEQDRSPLAPRRRRRSRN